MEYGEKEICCPKCGNHYLHCPECHTVFEHGEASHCNAPDCKKVNAPLDCKCGLVASQDLDGVLDLDMNLIPYNN